MLIEDSVLVIYHCSHSDLERQGERERGVKKIQICDFGKKCV